MGMQRLHGAYRVAFFDHKADVNFRGSLRDHMDVGTGLGNHLEYVRTNADTSADVITHETNDRFTVFHFDGAQLFQVVDERLHVAPAVNRDRYADLGGVHQVWRERMFFEDLEERSQETVGDQQARRFDVQDFRPLLQGDRAEGGRAVRRLCLDAGALALRIARVQDVNGDVRFDRWDERGGMEDLGAKICELGSFLEADDFNAPSRFANAWIGGQHAFDVGPDLDAPGA